MKCNSTFLILSSICRYLLVLQLSYKCLFKFNLNQIHRCHKYFSLFCIYLGRWKLYQGFPIRQKEDENFRFVVKVFSLYRCLVYCKSVTFDVNHPGFFTILINYASSSENHQFYKIYHSFLFL